MEHIKLFWSRLNIPTLLSACQEHHHWTEAVFLYSHYDQFDNAIDVLINHSTECWKHELFKETIKQVANADIYYKAIDFYLSEHPLLLTDLLLELVTSLDHIRVVNMVKSTGHLPIIRKYIMYVQTENLGPVNEAVNQMLVEEEDYAALKESIDSYDEFDAIALATDLEHHELLEFRRISAYLFKMNKKWQRSIEISKKDNLWSDALKTTAASKDAELAESLLSTFVENGNKECFSACLYTCYELIRPDVVLELAWRNDLMDMSMPFMVQTFRSLTHKVNNLETKLNAQDEAAKAEADEKKKADEEKHQADAAFVGTGSVYNPMMAPLQLPPPPGTYGYAQPQQQGYAQPQQQGFFQ